MFYRKVVDAIQRPVGHIEIETIAPVDGKAILRRLESDQLQRRHEIRVTSHRNVEIVRMPSRNPVLPTGLLVAERYPEIVPIPVCGNQLNL